MLTPVILSGGAGTRLWPLSRELYPKQLLPLTGTRTMLQQTVLRLEGLPATAPVIVCNEAHRFLVAEQLRQLGVSARATILEPFGRNTAPAIALAAHAALQGVAADANADDPVLLVLPADHVIRDVPAFQRAVRAAQAAAEPIYETMEGWPESTRGARSWIDLPATAIKYIRRIEELIEAPVALLSTSPEREDTILMHNPFEL